MIGKPDYIPADFTSWWEVRINREDMNRPTYVVVRAYDDGVPLYAAWFVQKDDADAFARLKNDVLLAGGAN